MAAHTKVQRGFSLSGLIIFIAVGGFFGILAARCLPLWLEFMAVQKTIKSIEANGETSVAEARKAFDRAAQIDRIESIKGSDVAFVLSSKGVTGVFDYEARVALAGNAALVFTFTNK